jgi:hypothetical protein
LWIIFSINADIIESVEAGQSTFTIEIPMNVLPKATLRQQANDQSKLLLTILLSQTATLLRKIIATKLLGNIL